MSKPIKPAYSPEAPTYRVSPKVRSEYVYRTLRKAGKDAAILLSAARQANEATTKTVVDQLQLLEIYELEYPGSENDIVPVRSKWVYVFDAVDQACVVEAFGMTMDGAQIWSYRAERSIAPASLSKDPKLDKTTQIWIVLPEDTLQTESLCRVFLSPVRLTPRALEYLLELMRKETVGRANPFVGASSTPPNELVAYVPDPFAWSQDASAKYYLRTLDDWVTWAQDPERAAKRFIAAQQKVFYESLKKQAADQHWLIKKFNPVDVEGILASRKSSGESHLEKDTAESNKRQKAAEVACAYVVACTDSHEHRAVEIACEDTGGGVLDGALAHWGAVMTAMESTAPGRDYLNELVRQTYRMPMQYVFTDAPPANSPDYKASVTARAGAAMILATLGPSVIRHPRENYAVGATPQDDAAWQVQPIADAANRILSGWAKFYTAASIVRASGTQDPTGDWSKAAIGDPSRKAVDVSVMYGTLEVNAVPGVKLDDAIETTEVVEAFKANTLSVLGAIEHDRLQKMLLPISTIKDSIEIASMVSAWTSKVSDSVSLADGPMGIFAADPATVLTLTTKGGQTVTSLVQAFKGETALLKGLGSGFSYVGGLMETVGHSQNLGRALADGNYGMSVGHGMSTTGAGLSTLCASLGMAKALGFTWSLIGAATPIGMLGLGVLLVGAYISRIFRSTPVEEFFQYCFLGSKYKNDPRVGFSWIDAELPLSSALEQAQLLSYILSGFHMERLVGNRPESGTTQRPVREPGLTWKREGGGDFAEQHFGSRFPGSWIRINLGNFPVGAYLEVQVKQRYVENYDHDSEMVLETGVMRFTHSSPGTIVRSFANTQYLGDLEIESYCDYATDGDSIRCVRFPLRPARYGSLDASASTWDDRRMGEKWQSKNCLVKARVNVPGLKLMWRQMPYGGRWCKFDSVESDEAHAMDPDSYME